ncbi:MAG: efflux RND transporter permease subunit [Rikenellaceae bacterium]
MNIKRFIDRPIFSAVISVVLVFVGVIGLVLLPVEQFPDVAPPTINVSTSYTGANAETVQKSVVVPLEEALNGVENMTYMTSSSSNAGSGSITVYFKQGTDPDMAAVNVQNKVSKAQGLLPSEVTQSGVIVSKRQSSNLKAIALYSPDDSFDREFIANYMKINLVPRLARISGVGEVNVMGADYALRIWLDPAKMAQYSLMPSDITGVLAEQNIEFPTGTLGANSDNTFQYVLKYKGRHDTEEGYENIVISSSADGQILRLGDVATVELGLMSYEFAGDVNGKPGTVAMIAQTSGSNANEIIEQVDALMEEVSAELPRGLEIADLFSTKDFLDASIDSVITTLVEAVLLVILVVYIFLQSFRSTIIPSISIVVSLIATFAFIHVAGFSMNMLTLFALVLVIGTVVDDAIVVVEAVQAKFDEGYTSPYKATIAAMGGITSALLTTTIVFMAVFIPVCFMGGTTGVFYTQFGVTMAIAVAISTLNAMTLSPALCALIMTPHMKAEDGKKLSFSSRFHIAFDSGFNKLVFKYKKSVMFFLKRRAFAFVLVILACGGLYYFATNTKTALVPEEDMGTIFVNVLTSPGSTLSETSKVMKEIQDAIEPIQEIRIFSKVEGFSFLNSQGNTNGMFIINLKNWSERTDPSQSVNAVLGQIYARTNNITTAQILAFAPPMITGYGVSNGFEMHLQNKGGATTDEFFAHAQNFIAALAERPEILRATTSFDTRYPQYVVDVDAALCKRNGVSPADVLSTMSGYIGGNYVSNMNKYSKLYRVMIQATTENRIDVNSLDNIYVRNSSGEMSPIKQYVTLERVYGSENLARFNMFPSISVNGMPADGYSSGQAIEAIRQVASESLPIGYGYEFAGLTREEAEGSGSSVIIFAICIVFVYLILCALYESIFIPLAVILSVPFGLLGSFLFAQMFGLTNNIYMQTGLIMLIGLLAKTAILLTEYASARRRAGMSITQAAITAAQVRLRPILMTSLTLIFGMLPMVFASGVGANGNISLGVGVVGGMIVGTIALVFIVPALFVIFQIIQERVMPVRDRSLD